MRRFGLVRMPNHEVRQGARVTAMDRVKGSNASIILGLGSGRCGTHTLAEVLGQQREAHFTHEQPPLLAWRRAPSAPGIRERLDRLRRTRSGPYIGDVASFYLPYAEEAIAAEPGIRMICLERPRDEVVASFGRWLDAIYPIPTDHWSRNPAPGWHQDLYWSRIFPKYDAAGREEAIRLYWEEYHRTAEELASRFPEHFRIFPTAALNDERGLRAILTFAGIPRDQQVIAVGLKRAISESARVHPRRRDAMEAAGRPGDPRRCAVLVPSASDVAPACEEALKALERRGYEVRRACGESDVDRARDRMAFTALADGFDETMWIGADIGFDPDVVDRLRGLGEPVACGIYPLRGRRTLACQFLPGTEEIVFGQSGGPREILYAAAGFLLVRRAVYMDIYHRLDLPVCEEAPGPPLVPFFQPAVFPIDEGRRLLSGDYAFCERARRCGHRIVADTAIRLWNRGTRDYGWEDAGSEVERFSTYYLKLT